MNHRRHVMGRELCTVRNPDPCVCWCVSKWVHVRLSGDCNWKGTFGGNNLIGDRRQTEEKGIQIFKLEEFKSLGWVLKSQTQTSSQKTLHMSAEAAKVCV